MDELPPRLKAYLRDARLEHAPPPGARERVRERIRFIEHAAANADRALPSQAHRTFPPQLRMLLLVGGAATLVGATVWLQTRRTEPEPLPQKQAIESAPSITQSIQRPATVPELTDAAVDARPARSQRSRRSEVGGADADRLVDELRLLSSASQSLQDAELARARKQLDSYRRRFLDGQLRAERDGLEMLCGCLTHAPGSVARARAYAGKVPGGLLVSRIETACQLAQQR